MAILKIARMGHPVLGGVAEPVADPRDPAIHDLVDDMIETLIDADGAGLAAPQVHVPLRLVLVTVPRERMGEGGEEGEALEAVPLTVLVNPAVTPLGEEMEEGWEGCLSLPGLAGRVPRFVAVHYRYQTLEGETVGGEARGFHARVLQHECDHLDGILYPMHMADLSTFGFVEEVRRAARLAAAHDRADEGDGPEEQGARMAAAAND